MKQISRLENIADLYQQPLNLKIIILKRFKRSFGEYFIGVRYRQYG